MRDHSVGVSPLVRRAWHAVGLARTAEAGMLGVGAGLAAAAGAIASGAPVGDAAIWIVALLAGVPMGLAWLVEMRPHQAALAQRIDDRLRQGGALVTAWEVESLDRRGSLGRLLGERLRRELRLPTVLAAATPNSIPLLAVPLLGVLTLVLALEDRPSAPESVGAMAGVIGGVAGALEEALDVSPGEISGEEADRLRELTQKARALGLAAERAGTDPERRADLTRQMDELAQSLEEEAQDLQASPEVARALDRALAHCDSVREGLESGEPSSGGAAFDPAIGEAEDPGLAQDGEQGTIPAAAETDPPENDREGPSLLGPEAGVAGGVALGPWWPDRHAGVVRRYVEFRREKASDRSE